MSQKEKDKPNFKKYNRQNYKTHTENRLMITSRGGGVEGVDKGVLLLLSCFSHVPLSATPQTAAHQAPLSPGFSRQEHWSGLPFPSPMHERKSENEVTQSSPTLSDFMDCSLPGCSIHGIFQATVLEWVAITFSDIKGYKESILQ